MSAQSSWKYRAVNDCADILLHDCTISSIRREAGSLILSFEDGFWLLPGHELNPTDRAMRTGPSEVCFTGCGSFSLCEMRQRRLYFFGRPLDFGRTWREFDDSDFERLERYIAQNRVTILTEYHARLIAGHLYDCVIEPGLYRMLFAWARPEGGKLWRFLPGGAYARYESKHREDCYDLLETGWSMESFVQLTVCGDGAEHEYGVVCRWNTIRPDHTW